MTTTFITGANKGLGLETARRLVEAGHTVYLGARDEARGRAAAEQVGATFVQLDVTSDASVARAAEELPPLDVLINNAGVAGAWLPADEVKADDVREVYETNVYGPVRVTQALLPLLRKTARPLVINVSSGLGSFEATSDPDKIESTVTAVAYCSSKSALNMITKQYAASLPDVLFVAVDPGYTATDLNDNAGHQTVQEGTDEVVRLATAADVTTASFSSRAGRLGW
jgi:NAD(P)-dependent dehydrogenase (short-subunit alcohol dehydrogenase family)